MCSAECPSSFYMLPLENILRRHGINFHIYADDTRHYISMSPDDSGPRDALLNCILDIFSLYCIYSIVFVRFVSLFSVH